MSDTLFVTTFNRDLYAASGEAMIRSFVDTQPWDMLACHENLDTVESLTTVHRKGIFWQSIDDNTFLSEWLNKNKDIIPKEFGGEFTCNCRQNRRKHRPDCPGGGFRRRTCHWFRKIVALEEASKMDYNRIIFTDCDTIYKKEIPATLLDELFDNVAVFYHYGPYRRKRNMAIETGFFGINRKLGGDQILAEVFRQYTSGEFRNYDRWDDSRILTVVVDKLSHLPDRDLITEHKSNTHVVCSGPFAEYVTHDKGMHARRLGLYR